MVVGNEKERFYFLDIGEVGKTEICSEYPG